MLPYSREVLYSLFAELNTRFLFVQIIASLLFLFLALNYLNQKFNQRISFALMALLWAACAYFWFFQTFAEINFLAPTYGILALIQACLLAIASLRSTANKNKSSIHPTSIVLIAIAFLWPLIDLFAGPGWPLVRFPGLHLSPLILLLIAYNQEISKSLGITLITIPLLFSIVIGFQAYVLNIHYDLLIPVIVAIFGYSKIFKSHKSYSNKTAKSD